jgi:hypothetical protein
MSTIINIAESIVAELSATTFSQPVTAVRYYSPRFDLPDMQNLHVSVVPRSVGSSRLDRTRSTYEYQVDIGVQQKIEPTDEHLDALMGLVEEIADHLRTQPLGSFPNARCTDVRNDPVFAADHLAELGQFTSVITATYLVAR